MDKVNALPASESEKYRGEYDVNDDNIDIKCQSPDNVGDDEDSSASSSTHSTSGVVSASSPGSQRDFYSTVSGAGDTYPLDSSEGARPRTLTSLNLDDTNMGETSIIRSSAKEFEENNRNGVDLRNISKEWSSKAQILNRSINTVLENIPDPKKVDVNIGKAAIKPGDKTVILALNKKKPKLNESIDSGLFSPPGISDLKFAETQDGIVLYCTIRLRDDFQDSNDVETLAIKDVFRQACLSPDHTVPNINLDAFDLGEKFRGRFGSPDGKSPRSKKSPRRSPSKGSPRKDNSDKDSEGTFTSTSSDLDDEEYATERENEAYKHRKGVGIGDDDDYRTMRSRPSDGREGSPKKSVTWRKELDGNTGGVGSNTNEGTKNATGDSSKTGSRESSASSPRRTGSGKSKTSDDDSPKSGSRSGSLSPKRRGSGDSKASSTSPRRRGSNESKGSGDGSSKSSSRRSSGEQSPRKRSGDVSKRGSGESVGYDENQKVGDQYDTNEVSSDRWGGDEYDNAGDQSARSQPGARSRALKRSEDTTSRRRYRSEYQGGRQVTDSSYDGNSLGDERRLLLNLDGSATSNEKDRLVKRHRKSLRRRRQRAELLTTGKPFDVQLSETEGDGVERRPRTKEEKRRLNELRRKYLNPDVDALEDGDYQEHDPDYDRMGDERHDNCFLPFVGYDENYDGPIGVLTSKLPDGTSTAGTLFSSFDIRHRSSSIAFLEFYDLQMVATGIYHKKST